MRKILAGLWFCTSLWAETLFVQFSDFHHTLSNVESAAHLIYQKISSFKSKYPTGKIVFIGNGDLAGVSRWSDFDFGFTGFELLLQFAGENHFVITLGNHDSSDFLIEGLFEKQLRDFKRLTQLVHPNKNFSSDFAFVTANIEQNPDIQKEMLIKDFQDLSNSSGKKMRIVGLVLDLLMENTNDEMINQTITKVVPMLETGKKQLELAAKDGIEIVLFASHETHENVQEFTRKILEWKSKHEDPRIRNIKIPIHWAAHDHLLFFDEIKREQQSTQVIDSGAFLQNLSFSIVDDKGNFSKNESAIVTIDGSGNGLNLDESVLPKNLQAAIEIAKKVQTKVDEEINNIQLGYISGIPVDRNVIKRDFHPLAKAIADTYLDWALENFSDSTKIEVEERMVSAFNPGSYRASRIFPPGILTLGDLKEMKPFPNVFPKTFDVPPAVLESWYKALRKEMNDRSKEIVPQTSSNLEERKDSQGQPTLFFQEKSGKWRPLSSYAPHERFRVTLDRWLATNGFGIQSEFYNYPQVNAGGMGPLDELGIFRKYLLPNLNKQFGFPCENLFFFN